MLKLYNTLTRKKDIFKPLKKEEVGIYTCGPTVYYFAHIGNLRAYVFADTLKRVLKINDYKIKHVMNLTDVGHLTSDQDEGEDKIEKEAKKENKTAKEISEFYTKKFFDDFKELNNEMPDIVCKATEHIKEQIELIKKLEKKGYTYKTGDGIYFNTSKFKDYGKFAKLNIKELKAGKRISMREKKNATDFALWKFSEESGKRQQEWDSPWGLGFPGWHIECSAMSMKYLGETFDIHTGGEDHIPVHHTNEIAQSECATGKKFVNYWMHASFLQFNSEKMSKSRGEILRLEDIKNKNYSPMDLRYFFLSGHYRKPLNFTFINLDNSKNALSRLKEIISKINDSDEKVNKNNVEIAYKQFVDIINDDLDTTKALSFMWEILREEKLNNSEKYELVLKFDKIFGLKLNEEDKIKVPEKIKTLVKEREKARKDKDFVTADKIREKIKTEGYYVNDTDKGWEIKRI